MAARRTKPLVIRAGEPHIALLRGVNVGGKNRLAMKDLAAMFEAAGCRDVETYIQSGNAIFKTSPARAKNLRAALERALFAHLGNKIVLVLRTGAELRSIARANPFLAAGADPDTLHVAFLVDAPSALQVAALDAGRSRPDAFAVRGREIYLHLPKGVAKTRLTNDYFDRTLKTTATVRNWRTVLALSEMAGRTAKS